MNQKMTESYDSLLKALPSQKEIAEFAFELFSDLEVHTRQELLIAIQNHFELNDDHMALKYKRGKSDGPVVSGRWVNVRNTWKREGYIEYPHFPETGSYQLTGKGAQELSIKYN